MKTAIVFDLDGTLLDTLGDLSDAVNHTLRRLGKPERTQGELRYMIGNGTMALLVGALAGADRELDMDQVMCQYRAYYDAHSCVKTGPYPGVVEALHRIQEQYPVAIVSNKPHPVVTDLAARFFPGIYALGESPDLPKKPAPDMVRKALTELGADRCIYVGDTEVDLETAQNAGAPCLCVLWGFRDRNQLDRAGAKYYCENAADLPKLMEQILGELYGQ